MTRVKGLDDDDTVVVHVVTPTTYLEPSNVWGFWYSASQAEHICYHPCWTRTQTHVVQIELRGESCLLFGMRYNAISLHASSRSLSAAIMS